MADVLQHATTDLSTLSAPSTLKALDEYLSNAVSTTKPLETSPKPVFWLYTQLLERLEQDSANIGPLEALLLPLRLVPFCQVYGPKNAEHVGRLLDACAKHKPEVLVSLSPVLASHLENLHKAIKAGNYEQEEEMGRCILDTSKALSGLTMSTKATSVLLLKTDKTPDDVIEDPSTLIACILRCYEHDLPSLQRSVQRTHPDKISSVNRLVAKARLELLSVTSRFLDAVMHLEAEPTTVGEMLLTALHSFIQSCAVSLEEDKGSLLSDVWQLYSYNEKCREMLEKCGMDRESVEYLDMIVDNLPRRRPVPASVELEEKPAVVSEESPPRTSSGTLDELISQVQDLLPDLGDGYVALCLLSSQLQVETVVNFLLEDNPPTPLVPIRRDLKRTDDDYQELEDLVTGKAIASDALDKEGKLDPKQVWIGKRTDEKSYNPQTARKNDKLTGKMREILEQYEQEDDYEDLVVTDEGVKTLDDYDDDYNDEFEDYEPFSVHDSGHGDDQDSVRELNRRMREKEAQDAFWQNMRNPNHRSMDDEREEKADAHPETDATSAPKAREKGGQEKEAGEKNAKQEQRQRARKDKNKAKVGNHHRKDRALKKRG